MFPSTVYAGLRLVCRDGLVSGVLGHIGSEDVGLAAQVARPAGYPQFGAVLRYSGPVGRSRLVIHLGKEDEVVRKGRPTAGSAGLRLSFYAVQRFCQRTNRL